MTQYEAECLFVIVCLAILAAIAVWTLFTYEDEDIRPHTDTYHKEEP